MKWGQIVNMFDKYVGEQAISREEPAKLSEAIRHSTVLFFCGLMLVLPPTSLPNFRPLIGSPAYDVIQGHQESRQNTFTPLRSDGRTRFHSSDIFDSHNVRVTH
jgi:hypothetical protein